MYESQDIFDMWLTAADVSRRLPKAWSAALVVGDEPLLVEESGDLLRAAAREQGFVERKVLEVNNTFKWGTLAAEASAMSLFGDKQLIELRVPEAKAGVEGGRALQEFVAQQSPDVALLVLATTTNAPPKDPAWMVRIAEAGVGVRCRKLRHGQLPQWLMTRAKALSVRIEPAALEWLASQLEGNLLAARQELEKLPLLGAPDEVWGLARLQQVVGDHARFSGFELPDVLLGGDLAAGLRMIARLRDEGVPPVLVISSLARDLRSLLMAAQRAGDLGPERACEAAGIWRHRQSLFAGALRRLAAGEVRRLHLLVVGLDRTAKSAPEARFWEDLINLSVRLTASRGQRVA
jgi:DNA polymerase-3 subunit delta